MRIRLNIVLALIALVGCKREAAQLPAIGAEEPGKFLNEPAGVPPAPLFAEYMQIHLDRTESLDDQLTIFAVDSTIVRHKSTELPGAVITMSDPKALDTNRVASLLGKGGRGQLILWYPVQVIRKRLQHGTANIWRGVIRMRDALSSNRYALGGTPVFYGAAVAVADLPLLQGGTPGGFTAVQTGDSAFFKTPEGAPIVRLVARRRDVPDGALDAPVESLYKVVKQGGRAWLLLSLSLAQEHKPAIH